MAGPALVGLASIVAGYIVALPAEPAGVERTFSPATNSPVGGPTTEPAVVQPAAAGAAAPPRASGRDFVPRDPQEWQGMRVDRARQAFCDSKNGCGLAMACIAGRCTGCAAAADCGDGETCVLEHCVRAELVGCTTRHDCAPGELCILSGYSGGSVRNNERMRSECIPPAGGVAQREGEQAGVYDAPPEARTPPGPASSLDFAELQREVEDSMLREATEPAPR